MSAKHVFIVGAGASADFGLPVGKQLAAIIRSRIVEDFARGDQRGLSAEISRHVELGDEMYTAADRLAAALVLDRTIDQTLHVMRNVPRLVELGKFCIAYVIAQSERSSSLFALDSKTTDISALLTLRESWLHKLFDKIAGDEDYSPDSIGRTFSNIAFITFNYDRCIEQYLFHALTKIVGWSESDARDALGSLSIEHVFGSLGTIHHLGGDSQFGSPRQNAFHTSEGIVTYREEYRDIARLAKIRGIVASAKSVTWLGFGFAPENMELLIPEGHAVDCPHRATTLGLTSSSVRIARRITGKSTPSNFRVSPLSCSQFMDEQRSWFTSLIS